jgi:hypothetical protein
MIVKWNAWAVVASSIPNEDGRHSLGDDSSGKRVINIMVWARINARVSLCKLERTPAYPRPSFIPFK